MAKRKKPRPFTLEDARQLAIIRAFMVVIEKKSTELSGTGKDGKGFQAVVYELRTLLKRLDKLTKEGGDENDKKHARGDECCDGYELCGDGICRVWCS